MVQQRPWEVERLTDPAPILEPIPILTCIILIQWLILRVLQRQDYLVRVMPE